MKILLNIAKYIGAVATIAGAALWFDARFDSNADSNKEIMDTLAVMRQDIQYNSVELSQLNESVWGIKDTLEDIEEKQEAQNEKINSVVWGLKHFNQFTPQQFEDILDEMLKKNDELILSPTVLSDGD